MMLREQQCRTHRDRRAALRLGGGGGIISDSILGGTRHFFLLTLYNFKNIGGGGAHASPATPTPWFLTQTTEVV